MIEQLPAETDVLIVGAGFSGIAMGQRLKQAGRDFVIAERASDVGGVWRDNTYPGAACDVPSHLYSLSFAKNPDWTRTYSHQPEILEYLRRVARDTGMYDHCAFDAEVTAARWDEDDQRWVAETPKGTIRARALVAAAGPLVEPKLPAVPGLDDFDGPVWHSARWNHDVDLEGKRVAVVGTGASAIQFIPKVVREAAHVTVFQRTAPWVLPRTERPITGVEKSVFRRFPAVQEVVRQGVFWLRESNAIPMLNYKLAPAIAALGRSHLRRQVADDALRAKLTPHFTPGCKRLLLSNDYYPALAKPHVDVAATGFTEVRGNTVVGADGTEAEVDAIIFGTGFEVTEPPVAKHVFDADGRSLADDWAGSMQAHRGTTVAGFPNLFFLLGPNSGTGHISVVYMAEQQADYAIKALAELDRRGATSLQPRRDLQDRWTEEMQERSKGTVWLSGGCASWYLDKQGRNTTLWPDYVIRYAAEVKTFDASEFEFRTAPDRTPVAA